MREKIKGKGGNNQGRTISIGKKAKKRNKDNDIFDIVFPATILCDGITVFKES